MEELDYLPDEVDDMDPQIAAVVIEKSLPRPRAGEFFSPFLRLPGVPFSRFLRRCTLFAVFRRIIPFFGVHDACSHG